MRSEQGDDRLKEVLQQYWHVTEDIDGTVDRVIRAAKEMTKGIDQDPMEILTPAFEVPAEYEEMIILRNISFHSLCEHHLIPFGGLAHVAYIPSGKLVGLSKLARIVHCFARRPQLQERLNVQIVAALVQALEPKGAAAVLVGQHGCMQCRGVMEANAEMVTSKLYGYFKDDPMTRQEFLQLIGV